MKKLRLLAMSADRQALLKELLLLGCVEVSEPTELPEETYPALSRCDSAELTRVKAQHAELTNAVKLLDKYSPEKSGFLKPLPEAEAAELLDEARLPEDIALAQKLMELEERIRRNGAEVLREQTQLETLAPWLPLDLPLSCKGTERAAAMTASLPAALDMTEADAALGAAAPEAQLFRVSDDKSLHYVLLVCLRDGLDAALEPRRIRLHGEAGRRAERKENSGFEPRKRRAGQGHSRRGPAQVGAEAACRHAGHQDNPRRGRGEAHADRDLRLPPGLGAC